MPTRSKDDPCHVHYPGMLFATVLKEAWLIHWKIKLKKVLLIGRKIHTDKVDQSGVYTLTVGAATAGFGARQALQVPGDILAALTDVYLGLCALCRPWARGFLTYQQYSSDAASDSFSSNLQECSRSPWMDFPKPCSGPAKAPVHEGILINWFAKSGGTAPKPLWT